MQLLNYTRRTLDPNKPNTSAMATLWTLRSTSPAKVAAAFGDRSSRAFGPVIAEPRDVCSRFGRRLKALRQQRSMTQSDMAKKFGIDRSFISDVERGRKSISLHTLEVIAIGMGVSLSKLFEDI